MRKVLVIGAGGQIGTELVIRLREKLGAENAIAADIKPECPASLEGGRYVQMDVLDREAVRTFIIEEKISEVYLLAALLSATAEKHPDFAWKLNMEGLFTILDLAKEGYLKKIFWPSSIAVFGPTTPQNNTHRKEPSWNRVRFMEFPSKQERDGANITITNMVLMCEVFVTQA